MGEPAGSTHPGAARGPCSQNSGVPAQVRAQHADAWVEYSNFKYGELDSTVDQSAPKAKPPPAAQPAEPLGKGKCCWGGCGAANCLSSSEWCSQSSSHCEDNCGGKWCAASALAAVGKVRQHRFLSKTELAMLQRGFKHGQGDATDLAEQAPGDEL